VLQEFEQQLAFKQIEPLGHTLPHFPQLLLSSRRVVQVPLQQWKIGPPAVEPQQPLPQGGATSGQQTPLTVLQTEPKFEQQAVLPVGPVQTWEDGQQTPPVTQVVPDAQQVVPQGVVPDGQHIPAMQVLPGQHCASDVHLTPIHVQFPATQRWPLAQTLPQAPQLLGSFETFVLHVPPPQLAKPAAHTTMHAPFWHILKPFVTRVGGQRFPQEPQLSGSDCVSVQTPLHTEKLSGQGAVHAPFAQNSNGGHTFPQLPQFRGSSWISVHVPLQHALVLGQQVIPAQQKLVESQQQM
jgi:hypothetical protein